MADGDAATGRATVLVAAVLGLLAISEADYGAANGGPAEVPFVAALSTLPMPYDLPETRPWWLRHRYLLLAAQAALTYLPFAAFGNSWPAGPSGWLAGLILLTLPPAASSLVFTALAVVEEAVRADFGLPAAPAPSAALWILVAFTIDALVCSGWPGWPTSSARSTPRGASSPRQRSSPSGSGRPTTCGLRSPRARGAGRFASFAVIWEMWARPALRGSGRI